MQKGAKDDGRYKQFGRQPCRFLLKIVDMRKFNNSVSFAWERQPCIKDGRWVKI